MKILRILISPSSRAIYACIDTSLFPFNGSVQGELGCDKGNLDHPMDGDAKAYICGALKSNCIVEILKAVKVKEMAKMLGFLQQR